MSYEVELQKLKQTYPKFFARTDPAVIDFILSDKTAQQITEICAKNGIKDEDKIEEIAQRVGLVMLDRLPSGNLSIALQFGVNLSQEEAVKIADDMNSFFSTAIIKIKNGGGAPKEKNQKKEQGPKLAEEKPKKSSSEDVYRELVE